MSCRHAHSDHVWRQYQHHQVRDLQVVRRCRRGAALVQPGFLDSGLPAYGVVETKLDTASQVSRPQTNLNALLPTRTIALVPCALPLNNSFHTLEHSIYGRVMQPLQSNRIRVPVRYLRKLERQQWPRNNSTPSQSVPCMYGSMVGLSLRPYDIKLKVSAPDYRAFQHVARYC